MDKRQKVFSFWKQNYRITNLIISIFLYLIVLAVVLSRKDKKIFIGYILPLLISLLIIVIISLITDRILNVMLKRFKEKKLLKLKKIEEEQKKPLSQNMVPIHPKLIEMKLTQNQYDKIINIRISNILLSVILTLILIYFKIDLEGNLYLDIILPILLITGIIGLACTILDIIIEKVIRSFYSNKKDKKKPRLKKENFFTKNKRIFYVPICILLAIIIANGLIDFKREDHIISRVIIPLEIINILTMIIIILIDCIISKYKRFKDLLENDIIEYDEKLENYIDDEC